MALAFKNLCADFCELAGLPPSEPDGEAGGASLAIEFDEVPLTIAQTEASAQDLVLVARLGTPQPDAELPVSRMVLEANYYLLGHDAPVFSRHLNPARSCFSTSLRSRTARRRPCMA